MKKRIFALLLAAAMIFSVAGCKKAGETSSTGATGDAQIPPANTELALPKYEIKDKVIKVLSTSDEDATAGTSLWAQAYKLAEENYGIKVEKMMVTDTWAATTTMLATGTPPSFVEAHKVKAFFPRLCSEGIFADVNTLINREDVMWKDMLKYNEIYSIGDKSFSLVTDVFTSETLYYNSALIRSAGLEDPMALYKKNEWTWDKMMEYIEKIAGDKNGDGVVDIYGIDFLNLYSAYMSSMGSTAVAIKDGKITTDPLFNGNYEKFGNFASNLLSRGAKGYYSPVENKVATAKMLFSCGGYWGIKNNPTLTAQMKAGEISLVPYPRHSEADGYYMLGVTSGYAIPAAGNPVAAAAVLSCFRYLKYPNEKNLSSVAAQYKSEGWNDDVVHFLTYDQFCQPGALQNFSLTPNVNFASSEVSAVMSKLGTDVLEKQQNWATVRDKYITRIQNAVDDANKLINK
ncbi:MAG: extracellular solute-binding protein [Clostridia bacterium]|nr:extracellular solute-binding protein [Clostridia bacterium]